VSNGDFWVMTFHPKVTAECKRHLFCSVSVCHIVPSSLLFSSQFQFQFLYKALCWLSPLFSNHPSIILCAAIHHPSIHHFINYHRRQISQQQQTINQGPTMGKNEIKIKSKGGESNFAKILL
jgi:hypothetical protein